MNNNQKAGLFFCTVCATYITLETLGMIHEHHLVHSSPNVEMNSIVSGTTSMASFATMSPFILGTSTLGSNDRLG